MPDCEPAGRRPVPTVVRNTLSTFALLVLGALSHHALDLLLVDPGGRSFPLFWPLTRYEPPTPCLFSSDDLWLVPVAAVVAPLSRAARDRA